jgi:hypothetical protein
VRKTGQDLRLVVLQMIGSEVDGPVIDEALVLVFMVLTVPPEAGAREHVSATHRMDASKQLRTKFGAAASAELITKATSCIDMLAEAAEAADVPLTLLAANEGVAGSGAGPIFGAKIKFAVSPAVPTSALIASSAPVRAARLLPAAAPADQGGGPAVQPTAAAVSPAAAYAGGAGAGGAGATDAEWLKEQVEQAFAGTDIGAVESVVHSVFELLASTKDDDTLQNDLFELVGFERFELIGVVLQNRARVVSSVMGAVGVASGVADRAAANDQQQTSVRTTAALLCVVPCLLLVYPIPLPSFASMLLLRYIRSLSLCPLALPSQTSFSFLRMPPPPPQTRRTPSVANSVTIQSVEQRKDEKRKRKEQQKLAKHQGVDESQSELMAALGFGGDRLRQQRVAQLEAHKDAAPLFRPRGREIQAEQYPNVYNAQAQGRSAGAFVAGSKLLLPEGTVRTEERKWEKVSMPPAVQAGKRPGERMERVAIASGFSEVGQLGFQGYKALNRVQSFVCVPTALHPRSRQSCHSPNPCFWCTLLLHRTVQSG